MKKRKERKAKKSKVRRKKPAGKRKKPAKKLKAKRKVKSKRKKKALAPAPSPRAPASLPRGSTSAPPPPMPEPSPGTTREWRTGAEAVTTTVALTMRKAGVYPQVRKCWAKIYGCDEASIRHTDRFQEEYGWSYEQRRSLATQINYCFDQAGAPINRRLEPNETGACLTIGALSRKIEERFPA